MGFSDMYFQTSKSSPKLENLIVYELMKVLKLLINFRNIAYNQLNMVNPTHIYRPRNSDQTNWCEYTCLQSNCFNRCYHGYIQYYQCSKYFLRKHCEDTKCTKDQICGIWMVSAVCNNILSDAGTIPVNIYIYIYIVDSFGKKTCKNCLNLELNQIPQAFPLKCNEVNLKVLENLTGPYKANINMCVHHCIASMQCKHLSMHFIYGGCFLKNKYKYNIYISKLVCICFIT